ncbi:MAG: SH3 domain-containing protein [Rhodocyclaceae bacterium]|jgi:hypothetical protein|nr:SH3 domain-containing protein [Rhodocyclaceae bacterium]MCL4757582.1 SH3 domain-containing protein [Rhodocyclaceae bacterium]
MNPILRYRSLVALAIAALACTAALAAPGKILRNSELREKPFLDAPKTGELQAQTEVEMLAREGGWIQVKSADGKTGWVRLLNVQPAGSGSGSGFLSGLATLGSVAATGSTGTTATTGAKGISREDLANAQPNPKELEALEKLASSEASGRKHASASRLRAQVSEPIDPGTPQSVGESSTERVY